MRSDGQTDTTKLGVASRNYAKAPNKKFMNIDNCNDSNDLKRSTI
jgi:hypothetical protein